MNFLDAYDIAGAGASTPQNQPEQSLNEEVSQVIGQLGRFWGGFRKQSQTALEAARKDLGEVVSQAQKELSKFTAETPQAPPAAGNPPDSDTQDEESEAGPSSDGDKTPSQQHRELPTSPTQSLFTRLQSSLPPNIVATVQTHLPETIKNASNVDFAQLRTNLSAEFQRVQGVTLAQAEGYVHKSEGLLREAMREAGEALRDAVKIIPPEEGESTSGIVWDGTDVWMLPAPSTSDSKGKGKQSESPSSSGRPSGDTQRSAATRAQSLLKQLRYDPAVIRVDPETEEGVKQLYTTWLHDEIDSKDGGLKEQQWVDRTSSALNDSFDGQALQATHDSLVPSEITDDTFWKRYHFRVHQVEKDEEIRKALLQRPVDHDDEFSWEDEEEDSAATSPLVKHSLLANETSSQRTLMPKLAGLGATESVSSSLVVTPATTSPRQSEDSYDLVSSGSVSGTGEAKMLAKKVEEAEEDEEDDEDDDDDEDEDEDEDEEEEEVKGNKEVVKGREDEDEEDEDEEDGSGDSDWE